MLETGRVRAADCYKANVSSACPTEDTSGILRISSGQRKIRKKTPSSRTARVQGQQLVYLSFSPTCHLQVGPGRVLLWPIRSPAPLGTPQHWGTVTGLKLCQEVEPSSPTTPCVLPRRAGIRVSSRFLHPAALRLSPHSLSCLDPPVIPVSQAEWPQQPREARPGPCFVAVPRVAETWHGWRQRLWHSNLSRGLSSSTTSSRKPSPILPGDLLGQMAIPFPILLDLPARALGGQGGPEIQGSSAPTVQLLLASVLICKWVTGPPSSLCWD